MNVLQELLFEEIVEERRQQDAKWGPNSLRCVDPCQRLCVLVEEVGEAAQVVNDLRDPGKSVKSTRLREELIQVAAVALAWLEVL